MTEDRQIPLQFKTRFLLFKNQVREHFDFLKDYKFKLDKEENGRTENFKDYFLKFTYINGDTVLNIHFSTDIVNGMKTAFPKLRDEELPVVDSQITCSIWDKAAIMIIPNYIELKFPEISSDNFTIKPGSSDLEKQISRVVKNYSDFFQSNLISVLEKKIIYDCYTDRFYDKVFKEIHYR
jgi:hypothetical protein